MNHDSHTHMTLTAGHASMLAELAIRKYTDALILASADDRNYLPHGYSTSETRAIKWAHEAITETARMANGNG